MAEDVFFEFQYRGHRFTNAERGLQELARSMSVSMDSLGPVFRREMQHYLESVADALAKRHGNPWPGGTGPNSLSKRSGGLIQSIRDSIKVYGTGINDVQGEIGGSFLVGVHEKGATITAKKSKYLTIPLPAALNSNGTPLKKSARDWDKTFIIRSKAGNLLIVRRLGSSIQPLYVLKTSVKIPPRLNMGKTLRAGTEYFAEKAMTAMVHELQKALG